jgi:hypothetical protein
MFPPIPPYWNENLPLPQGVPYRVILENGTSQVIRSPVVNTVPGALEIQQMLERSEWAFQAANSLVYASCLRRHPLNGVPAKPVIVQFAYGDRLVVNPSTTALLRAGDLADRATFFRSDLAFPSGNPTPFPNNPTLYPHSFLQLFAAPALTARALQAQEQIASFFALDGPSHALDPFDGTQIIDPDSDGPIFEVPIVLPLPIRLNWPGSPALAALSSGAQQLTAGVGEVSEPGRGEVNPVLDLPQPNPLNPSTTLTIHLSASTRVSLAIYDMQGRLVRTLAAGEPMQAGTTRAHWDGRTEGGEPAAPGVYFVRLEAAKFHLARRTVVLK